MVLLANESSSREIISFKPGFLTGFRHETAKHEMDSRIRAAKRMKAYCNMLKSFCSYDAEGIHV